MATVPVVTTIYQLNTLDDQYSRQSGAGFGNNSTNLLVQDANANNAFTTGFRFRIPSNIPAADITDVRLVMRAQNTTSAFTDVWYTSERIPAAAWADNTTHRPIHRQTTARAAGSTTQLGNIAATTANVTVITSPNMSTDIKAAMTHGSYVAGTSYVSVIVSPRVVSPSQTLYVHAQNTATSAYRPYLEITYDVLKIDGAADATIRTGNVTPKAIASAGYTKFAGVNYQNGTTLLTKDVTASGARLADIYSPQGTAPTGGWPVVIWVHGGFFTSGNRATMPAYLLANTLARGYAVVSVDYRLVEIIANGFEFLANGNEASFPLGIHDLKVLINFLRLDQAGAKTYNIDVHNLILTGFSAGGSIVQFAAYSKGDTNTYEGMDSSSWSLRPAPVGRADNANNYYYDFNQNGMSGIDNFTVKGLFLFAGATSLKRGTDITYTSNGDARSAISHGRRAYLSRSVDPASIDTSTYGEIDVDKYLSPASGTPTTSDPYLGKAPVVPDYPIGYVRGTSDILVTKGAGYDPIETGLIANGYISGAPTLNATNITGLSYYEIPGVGHDAMEYNIDGLRRFFQWLDATQVVSGPYFTYWDGMTEHDVVSAVYWNGSVEVDLSADV